MSIRFRLFLFALITALVFAGVTYWTVVQGPNQGASLAMRQFDPGPGPATNMRVYAAGSDAVVSWAVAIESVAAIALLLGPACTLVFKRKTKDATAPRSLS
jgi:hypothetical protein